MPASPAVADEKKDQTMSNQVSRMNPQNLPDAGKVGYSQISIAEPGRMAFVSGQVAWRRDGGAVPGDLAGQAKIVIENLEAALQALGSRPHDIVQMRIYATDLRAETQAMVMGLLTLFLDGAQPSITGIGVTALATPDLQLEIEMIVRVPG